MTARVITTPDDSRYRTLIVDDERLARVGLRALLTEHPEFVLAGEASNGAEAAAAIRTMAPHLVFLDIQMPERDGFRVLADLAPHERPAVIFVTAHRQFALEAFGVNAVDYLLKPFSRQRFAQAVRRALHFLRGASADVARSVAAPRDSRRLSQTGRLAVRDRDRLVFVDPADILWFEVYGNYLRLAVGRRYFLLRSTLNAIDGELDQAVFVRISRSVLVNVRHVESITSRANGQYELIIAGGTVLRSSRRYRRDVRGALGR
jgi:two-component system LytT family response regulator